MSKKGLVLGIGWVRGVGFKRLCIPRRTLWRYTNVVLFACRYECTFFWLLLRAQAFDVAGAAAGADCHSVRADFTHASQRPQELHGPYQRQLKQVAYTFANIVAYAASSAVAFLLIFLDVPYVATF